MKLIDKFLEWMHAVFKEDFWVIEIFFIVLITGVVHSIEAIILRKLLKKAEKTKNFWDDIFLNALHQPLEVLIWVAGVSIAANIAAANAPEQQIFSLVGPIRTLGFIAIMVWFIVRLIKNAEKELIAGRPGKKALDKTTVHAISQLLTAVVVITGTLVGLQTFGVKVTGVLALGGVGGIILGFAAKDLLANFFGGMMVFLDRPFKVGDWIRSPDKQIEGTVEYIGWRLTRIRTFDKRPLYVPNSIFSTIAVENPSRMLNRRIYTTIGLRYDDATKIDTILKDVENMLQNHEEIDTNQTLMVNLIKFGPSSLDFMIYTFTKTTNWVRFQAIQQDVFLKTIAIIEKHGAQCAFPTQTVHIPKGLNIDNQARITDEPT